MLWKTDPTVFGQLFKPTLRWNEVAVPQCAKPSQLGAFGVLFVTLIIGTFGDGLKGRFLYCVGKTLEPTPQECMQLMEVRRVKEVSPENVGVEVTNPVP